MYSPICVLLGHADAGKTSILDAIRHTLFAYKETGGLTQNIGVTEIPTPKIAEVAAPLLEKLKIKIDIPSILFIDSPGHESFITLREKGASVADLAILVIDINEGVQNQTAESLNILRKYKTPFLVALTKIDTLSGYNKREVSNFQEFIESQNSRFQAEFYEKFYKVQSELQSFNFESDLYYQIKDYSKTVAIVPLSSKDLIGIPDLLVLIVGLSQKYKLSDRPKDTRVFFLEKKLLKGVGEVVDSILYSGKIKIGDTIYFSSDGHLVQDNIKAIFRPMPLSETRENFGKFEQLEELEATAPARLVFRLHSPDIGTFGFVNPENIDAIKKEFETLSVKYDPEGIVLVADSIGSIEALYRLVDSRGLKVSRTKIGEITKDEILAALSSKIIVAFNVEPSKQSIQLAIEKGVYIIYDSSIYKLMEKLDAAIAKKEEEDVRVLLSQLVLPGKVEVLPGFIFRKSKPAIIGIKVVGGIIKKGYPLMNTSGNKVGEIKDIQENKKSLEVATTGQEVAISIEGAEYGKDFKEGDILYTRPSAQQIIKLLELSSKLSDEQRAILEEIRKIVKL
jgi:translation initiation factor 5B